MQEGGFPGLSGRVDEEILLCFDEPQNIAENIPKRIDHIMILGITKPGGVEVSFHKGKGRECFV